MLGAPKVNVDFGASAVVVEGPENRLLVTGGAGEGVLPKVKGALVSVADGGAGEGEAPKVNTDLGASGAGELEGWPKLKGDPLALPKRGFGASIVGADGAVVLAAGAPNVNRDLGGSEVGAVAGTEGAGAPKSGAGLGVLATGLTSASFGASALGAPKEKGDGVVALGASGCWAGPPKPNRDGVLAALSAGASAGFEGPPKLKAETGVAAAGGVEVGSAGLGTPNEKGLARAVVVAVTLAGADAVGAPKENPLLVGADPNREATGGFSASAAFSGTFSLSEIGAALPSAVGLLPNKDGKGAAPSVGF